MDIEGVFEAVVGIFIILILMSVLSDVIFAVQGRLWGIVFIIASVALAMTYILSEI